MAKQKKINSCKVPFHELEALAQCLLPDIRAYFESAEGKREFLKWKAAQHNKNPNQKGNIHHDVT